MDTDASESALGAELSQEQEGRLKVIAYASCALNAAQKNYCATRKELLAVVVFTRRFRHYLLGRQFTLRTDHGSLTWLMRFRTLGGQLARWLEELSQYDMVIQHRPGKQHANADGLSRIPPAEECCTQSCAGSTARTLPCQGCPYCTKAQEQWEQFQEDVDDVVPLAVRAITQDTAAAATWLGDGYTKEELKKRQLEDPTLKMIWQWRDPAGPTDPTEAELALASRETKTLWAHRDQIEVRDGLLCYRWLEEGDGGQGVPKLLLPRAMIPEVLELAHGLPLAGHMGQKKTEEKVRQRFYWIGLRQDTQDYVRSCAACNRAKHERVRPRGPLQSFHAGYPMERVHIDLLGPFPLSRNGNRYVLMVIDQFTKWVECLAIPDQSAETVAAAFVNDR